MFLDRMAENVSKLEGARALLAELEQPQAAAAGGSERQGFSVGKIVCRAASLSFIVLT